MAGVILINPFEVPQGREEECVAFWERVAEYMRRQPGFISTRLHRSVAPGARFALINVAEWESAEHFQAATASEEFKKWLGLTWKYFLTIQGSMRLSELKVTARLSMRLTANSLSKITTIFIKR